MGSITHQDFWIVFADGVNFVPEIDLECRQPTKEVANKCIPSEKRVGCDLICLVLQCHLGAEPAK